MKQLLVASNNADACKIISKALGAEYKVCTEKNRNSWVELVNRKRYEIIFIDITFLQEVKQKESHSNYKKVLQLFWKTYPTTTVIVMAPPGKIRQAVEVVKAGASNYLTYPLDEVELKYVVESIYESDRLESELDYFRSSFWQKESLDLVRTKSTAMEEVLEKVMAVAPTKTTVLLTGETGTGKGVMAKLIHAHSSRRDNLFVSVHCGAIPDNLVESELFGHEKGAFTGAVQRNFGKFEIAQCGTMFLDEIGTVAPSVQIKLLNVLQEKIFQRVVGHDIITCDVRIIAATNIDLKKMCDEGLLRRDLYYRLNVFPIELPSLQGRVEDIPLLAEVFLQKLNKLYTKEIRGIHTEVIDAFQTYSWPGNIREIEHLIERAYILESDVILTPESFPIEIFTHDASMAAIPLNTSLTIAEVRRKALNDVE